MANPRQRLQYQIEIEGCNEGDIELARDEAFRLIREGFLTGGDENETGRYYFMVTDTTHAESTKLPPPQSIEEKAWVTALSMVMSEFPVDVPDIHTVNTLMAIEPDNELPSGFVVWEPFEHWDVPALQGLIEEFHDTLLAFADGLCPKA